MTKFSFFTIREEGEQKDNVTTTASVQAPFIQQKQVDKIEVKNKYSSYTFSYHAVRLFKKFQPLQHQVRDSLSQAKQHNFSNKESNLLRFRFNKRFPIFHWLKIDFSTLEVFLRFFRS
jgi:hypothetical protein